MPGRRRLSGETFRVEELLARLIVVRRASGWTNRRVECGPMGSSTPRVQTVNINHQPVDLTSYEQGESLSYLMLHAGELVSKADLTEHIYQQDFDRDSNVL